jgi:uncharacterized protein (UPF0332 family)
MNAREFLILARSLAGGAAESAWRSSVSRAYYASFHVARELIGSLGFRVPYGESAHRYLVLRLSNCGASTVAAVGRQFDQLRWDRNRADYELHQVISARTSQTSVHAAEQIIRLLDAAALEPTRTQITDAMKIYERDVLQERDMAAVKLARRLPTCCNARTFGIY